MDVDGGRGGRVSVGAYVCRVVMVVERGCYWGEKEQKKKKSLQACAHTQARVNKHVYALGHSLLWVPEIWIVWCVWHAWCVRVTIDACVCSPAAGFMPHRVSLPAC